MSHSGGTHEPDGTSIPMRDRELLKSTWKGLQLRDERNRRMAFPRRQDYVGHLQEHGLITDEAAFIADDQLTEAVYLDWLRRPQVGCVFAQLLARPVYRTGVRTVVVRGSSGLGDPKELAIQIARLAKESVRAPSDEALSVLLPQILGVEALTHLVWELGNRPGWAIEREHLWRKTLVLVGLRVEIKSGFVAETLGMGPFDIFPATRRCPITTLEIRTKTERAKKSHLSRTNLALHLADIPVDHVLKPGEISSRANRFTPWLKSRILGKKEDMRAKASVTYSVPAAIWSTLKASGA